MKRFITIAILLLPALFACNKSSDNDSFSTNVVLSLEKVDLLVGETVTLTATVLPESLGMGVVWSVLDDTYAEVSDDGTVTAKAEGVTYVIATSADGNAKGACMVSVNPDMAYKVTINDELGRPITAVYGYPGKNTNLYAVTSDGEDHDFTWSIDDDSVASISEDGRLTCAAVESSDPGYVYDAQSYIKVVTEDGYGCKIPIRSSLLKGVKVESMYHPAGFPISLVENASYPIAILYEGESGTLEVPADGVNADLTNTTDFSLERDGDAFLLVTGPTDNVSTKLSVSAIGTINKFEIAEFHIEKSFPIRAALVGKSSSTLSFGWTEGQGADVDVSKAYTINLYKDAECTDLFLTYSIPSSDPCWNSQQPRFVFSGLDSGTTYWFKASETGSDEIVSAVIEGKTDPFTIVEPSSTPASAGDIILAEDFSELCWYADEVTQAAGYEVGSLEVATFQDRTVNSFRGYRNKQPGDNTTEGIITKYTNAKRVSTLRLGKWANGYYARMYMGPGYVFLSTYNYTTHLISPALDNIPDETEATLQVTIHAAGYQEGAEAVLAVQQASVSFNLISGSETNKNKLKLTDNAKTITFTGGFTTLGEFTVTLEGVKKGDRIAFGPPAELTVNNNNMMLISDMTVKILELN